MKTKLIAAIFAPALMVATIACEPKKTDSKEIAEEQNEQKLDDTKVEKDAEFATTAADGGLLEVRLGELAQQNGNADVVKRLGKAMVDEHTKSNQELASLAAQKNISLPQALSEKNQEKFNDLAEKTGTDFDEAYTDFMVKDHKDDLDAFKKEAEDGNDPEIQSWASGKIQTLEHHLMMAEEAQKTVKAEARNN